MKFKILGLILITSNISFNIQSADVSPDDPSDEVVLLNRSNPKKPKKMDWNLVQKRVNKLASERNLDNESSDGEPVHFVQSQLDRDPSEDILTEERNPYQLQAIRKAREAAEKKAKNETMNAMKKQADETDNWDCCGLCIIL